MSGFLAVESIDAIPTYSPPLHSGTSNRRLVGAEAGAGVEVVLGRVEPGGEAEPHAHERSWQIMVLLTGAMVVRLDQAPEQRLEGRAVVRIPPGVQHSFSFPGPGPAEVLLIYSPSIS